MRSYKILHGQLTLLPSQGLIGVKDLFSFSQLVSELICSLPVSVLLQPELYYGALSAPRLGNEASYTHVLIVPLTPRVWTNTNKPLSSLGTVQLKDMLFYLSPPPWLTSWCLSARGAMESGAGRKDARLQGYSSEALLFQGRRRGEGKRERKHWRRD